MYSTQAFVISGRSIELAETCPVSFDVLEIIRGYVIGTTSVKCLTSNIILNFLSGRKYECV